MASGQNQHNIDISSILTNEMNQENIQVNQENPSSIDVGTIDIVLTESEFDTEMFIQEIRQLPCIWNTSISSYKDRNVKANAWNTLKTIFNKDGECL